MQIDKTIGIQQRKKEGEGGKREGEKKGEGEREGEEKREGEKGRKAI